MLPPVGGEGKRFGLEGDPNIKQKKPKSGAEEEQETGSFRRAAAEAFRHPRPVKSMNPSPACPRNRGKRSAEVGKRKIMRCGFRQSPAMSRRALLRGPTKFHNGVMSVEASTWAPNSSFTSACATPTTTGSSAWTSRPKKSPSANSPVSATRSSAKVAPSSPRPLGWHRLTLKLDGLELYGELDDRRHHYRRRLGFGTR